MGKIIKKQLKIAIIVMAAIIAVVAGAVLTLQNSKVQTYLTGKLAAHFAEKLNTKITIGRVDVAFFKRIILEDVLIEDQQADTLLYVQSASAKIDTLNLRKRKLSFHNIALDD